MNNNKRTPQIRFAGFTDDWEQRKLGEIVEIVMGQSPSSRNYTDNPNDFILVQGNADIKNGFVYPRVWTKEITKTARKGTLIFSVRAPVGDIAKTNYDVVLGRGVASINGNEFIYQTLSKIKITGFWEKLSSGSTFESINSNDIRNAEIYIPSQEEQTAIGNFFKQLDDTIALHQREYEKYKNLKNSYLEKMFPKENEQFPELRFPEFTDAWEQRKLGDCKDVRDGTHDSPMYYEIGYPLVTSKNLSENGLDLNDVSLISEQDYNEINKRSKVDVGDILLGLIGTIGNPVQVQKDGYAIKNVGLIKNGGNVCNEFLLQLFKSSLFKKYIEQKNTGNTQKFLGLETLRNYEFFCPTIAEQTAIGNFFKQLDKTIALHQRKAEKFKQIKQFYLEKMFV